MHLRLLTHHQVAELFDKHPDTWRKLWPRWVETKGFPPPIEGPPYLWDETHLVAWLDRNLPPDLRDTVLKLRGGKPGAESEEDEIGFWQRELDRRFGV